MEENQQQTPPSQVIQEESPVEQVTPELEIPEKKSRFPRILIYAVVALILLAFGVFCFWYRFKREAVEVAEPKLEVKVEEEEGIVEHFDPELILEISTRQNVDVQQNINPGQTVSSGFVRPSLIKAPGDNQSSTTFQVYANETDEPRPFLFYVKDKITIKAFDLTSGIEVELFDLRDFPEISIKDHTTITNQYFINRTKQIIFKLQEQLGEEEYEISFNLYDLKTQALKEIIVNKGSGAEDANWQGFRVSPNEEYMFVLYINPYPEDPFTDVPNLVTDDPSYYDNTYFFYHLPSDSLTRFKTSLRLGSYIDAQWSENSKSILLRYGRIIFARVYPNKEFSGLVEIDNPDREFKKSQYFEDLNKIFYISSGSTKQEETYRQEKFGFFEPSDLSFNDLTEPEIGTLQFVYDFNDGVIFDQFKRVNGVVTDKSLMRYDLETGEVEKMIDGNLFVIGFNGDHSHLLLSEIAGQKSKIYDFDIKTKKLNYLTLAPVVISFSYR